MEERGRTPSEKVYPLVRHYPTNSQILDVEDGYLYPTGGLCYHFKRENVFWPRKSFVSFDKFKSRFQLKKHLKNLKIQLL